MYSLGGRIRATFAGAVRDGLPDPHEEQVMDWIQVLYSDVLPWLMERSDPSVRYWTLTRLLGRPEDDAEVAEARQVIMARGPAALLQLGPHTALARMYPNSA